MGGIKKGGTELPGDRGFSADFDAVWCFDDQAFDHHPAIIAGAILSVADGQGKRIEPRIVSREARVYAIGVDQVHRSARYLLPLITKWRRRFIRVNALIAMEGHLFSCEGGGIAAGIRYGWLILEERSSAVKCQRAIGGEDPVSGLTDQAIR